MLLPGHWDAEAAPQQSDGDVKIATAWPSRTLMVWCQWQCRISSDYGHDLPHSMLLRPVTTYNSSKLRNPWSSWSFSWDLERITPNPAAEKRMHQNFLVCSVLYDWGSTSSRIILSRKNNQSESDLSWDLWNFLPASHHPRDSLNFWPSQS